MGGGLMREKSAECVEQAFSVPSGKVVKPNTVSVLILCELGKPLISFIKAKKAGEHLGCWLGG